jgi:hypothetical protein
VDQEQQAKEAELLAMVQDTGLTAVDLGIVPVKVDFRDHNGSLRGSLERIEVRSDRPDQARFAVALQFAPMTFADALRTLHLARDLASRWSGEEPITGMEPPQETCAVGAWG